MDEIASRPETEYGTKQCMQSPHRMPETNLAGIEPPDIRRETNGTHSLYGYHFAHRRLKSRNCVLRSVKPAELSPKIIRCNEWLKRLQTTPHKVT